MLMDTSEITPGCDPCTAVDDCTRYRVLDVYPRRTAVHAVEFLERVNEEMPFAVQHSKPPVEVNSSRSRPSQGS